MRKSILNKLLIVILIVVLTSTDFIMLGSSIISYASELNNSTNNTNIDFSVYFKNEKGNRVDTITENVKKDDIRLYAEIKVKKEGYFNGTIELLDSNLKLKNRILSNAITKIEGNKVNLNQINAGETVEIELAVEPIIAEKITVDMLSKASTIKLTGEYRETKQRILTSDATNSKIEATKTVTANLQEDKETNAELTTDIITNKVFSINGKNKRIVQLLLKSRLSENQYPVKQTKLNIDIPKLSNKEPEEIKVLSLGTKATNGKNAENINDWTNKDGKLEIVINI